MHWIRVTRPEYEQSQRYAGQVGEVVGRWGPENSTESREGYLVQFPDGDVVGISDTEADEVDAPASDEVATDTRPG
jgi:hypothetical protein